METSSELAGDLSKLELRIGSRHLRQRLWLQSEHVHKKFGKGRTFIHLENFDWVHRAISGLVRISGLYGRGSANSREFEITINRIELAGLPPGFNGFRILQLTDMHLDSGPTVSGDLRSLLMDIDHDLCVITGDFRFATSGDYRKCLDEASKVVDILPNPIYAVLGNHDFIEMVTPLEEMGIQLLLNEATRIRIRDEEIWLAGVDDPHRFKHSRTVAAHFGLTPRRFQSGEIDIDGHISRCGDRDVRCTLYTAANVLLTRSSKWSPLKAWGMKLAKTRGHRRAVIAVARKLAVILHRMWLDDTSFRWSTEVARS